MIASRPRVGRLLIVLVLAACSSTATAPSAAVESSAAATPDVRAGEGATGEAPALGPALIGPTEAAIVLSITDGDTIRVDRGRGSEPIRYIGVDTPEMTDGLDPDVQELAEAATAANRELVEGREVILERDVSERDRFDRLLRYVWVRDGGDWKQVNLALVAGGYARVVTYPPDVRYVDLLLSAERDARQAKRGLWADAEAEKAPPAFVPLVPQAPGADCDPAYPDVCIPPAPPDLDCADVPFRHFAVRPPDPHRFDGNSDGVGCEGP